MINVALGCFRFGFGKYRNHVNIRMPLVAAVSLLLLCNKSKRNGCVHVLEAFETDHRAPDPMLSSTFISDLCEDEKLRAEET